MTAVLAGLCLLFPAADDGASVDSLVKALYDVISGPAGQKRDWARMRALFAPEARMAVNVATPEGNRIVRFSVEDYIGRSGPVLERDGFFEKEVARREETFAGVAHVWSTYEGRRAEKDEKPFLRGINTIQLVHDGKRWQVHSILWQAEDAKNPLPAKYLPK